MPQPVPRLNRLHDPRMGESGAEVETRQLPRVERRTEQRVAEHEVLAGLVAARRPLLLEAAGCPWPERHRSPAGSRLRRRDLAADDRLSHMQTPLEQLDVLPAKA